MIQLAILLIDHTPPSIHPCYTIILNRYSTQSQISPAVSSVIGSYDAMIASVDLLSVIEAKQTHTMVCPKHIKVGL